MTTHPVAISAADAEPRRKKSNYPDMFAVRMEGREKRVLGDVFGLTNFGVNLTRLMPGAQRIVFRPDAGAAYWDQQKQIEAAHTARNSGEGE